MNFFAKEDTIIANSSCDQKNAAISVIRISGFKNISQFQKSFSFDLTKVSPRNIYHTNIVSLEGKVLDQILFSFFKGPKSYTGENLIELFVHGNKLNINRIINLFVKNFECRLAEPGEFTFRALKNKKMSISEVEGLEMVLNAETPMMLDSGQKILLGDLNLEYQKLFDLFVKIKTSVELMIDFSEDVDEDKAAELFKISFEEFKKLIISLHSRCQAPISSILSPSIVLLGQTNAGKSTLFNHLLREQRSIVSSKEGTTRDFITEYLGIDGNTYKLIDSAGLRKDESSDEIEDEGMNRAINLAKNSFFRVLVINRLLKPTSYFKEVLKELSSVDLIVFTHSDFEFSSENMSDWSFLDERYKSVTKLNFLKNDTGPIGPEGKKLIGPIGPISNLEEELFFEISKKYKSVVGDNPITLERHRRIIEEIFNKINELCTGGDAGILAHEVFELGNLLSSLIGIITPDHLLTSIFNNFCIGK